MTKKKSTVGGLEMRRIALCSHKARGSMPDCTRFTSIHFLSYSHQNRLCKTGCQFSEVSAQSR